MLRALPSLWIARRHGARMVALLLAAQLALFAHVIGHDYAQDADQGHVVCGLCMAAQHLDHGLASAPLELPIAPRVPPAQPHATRADYGPAGAAFQARAPPLLLPS